MTNSNIINMFRNTMLAP